MNVQNATMTTEPTTEHPAVAELRALELSVLTSYTLADAIREGSSVTRQRVGGWVGTDNACAIGAGYLAARARGYAV
jgi:hypothetical protein